MDHNLVVKEKPGNFPEYKWEVTCSCGWQGRGPTEDVAASLGTSHGGTLPPKKEVAKATVAKPLVSPAPKP